MSDQLKVDEVATPERELVEQFAGFLKCSFIYPSNNERVQNICTEVLSVMGRLKDARGSRLVISLDGDKLVVAGTPVTIDSPMSMWLRDAFLKTALGGVELEASVERTALAAFAEKLRENFARPDKNYSTLWQGEFPGIKPFELRFAGMHTDDDSHVESGAGIESSGAPGGGSGNQDRVMRVLLENEHLMQRLEHLQSMLAEHRPEGEAAQVNILEPIRQALPVEAVLNPGAACELVDKILEICESKVLAMTAKTGFTDQEAMEVTIAGVGRKFFKARVQDMAETPQDALPEGRPEDESIQDDIELMLAEFEALPIRDDLELRADGIEFVREALGVYVHDLVHAASDEAASATLIRKILDEHPEEASILQPYVDICCSPAGLEEENRNVWRVVEILQASDPTGILEGKQFLTPKVVQFTFPRQFVPYIDSLAVSDTAGLNHLADICRRLGPARIEKAADYLIESAQLVTRKRLKKLLSVDSEEILPLAGIIAKISDDWVRDAVARFIRTTNPPVQESAALRVVRPLVWLSPQYLQGLCVRNPDREHRRWLQDESGRLLRVFLRDTDGVEELVERRLRAIHMLAALPSEENLEFLREIIKKQRFGLLRKSGRGLRAAARKACKEIARHLANK